MSKKKRFGVSQALTRGLSETIHVVENNTGLYRNVILPLSRIELDPDNPRKLAITLTDIRHGLNKEDSAYERKVQELERLKELASTIENSGIINPVVVYKRGDVYRVIAGERRCLASILASKQEIDARIFSEKPKPFELKLLQWVENTAREDLSLAERVDNIREILHEYHVQQPDETVSATLLKSVSGLSLPQATYYLAVVNAPKDVKEAIESGKIRNLDKAATVAGIESDMLRHEALAAAIQGCSLKELRKMISKAKQHLPQSTRSSILPAKRGRATTRINMGFTGNPHVVRTLVYSVLTQPAYSHYTHLFSTVNWDQFNQSTAAFKKLIGILEKEGEK